MSEDKKSPAAATHATAMASQDVYLTEDAIDLSKADWDPSLTRVIHDDPSGDIVATIDRLIFESPLTIAARYLEPQGYQLNFENILACVDSMKFGVTAKVSSRRSPDNRVQAKRIFPLLYMRKPSRTSKGPLLSKFYEEIKKYESELARLQQYEAQSRKAMNAAVKDESGRSAIQQLQRDNDNLKQEIERLTRKVNQLSNAIDAVPLQKADQILPLGLKVGEIRSVSVDEGLAFVKVEQGQFSVALARFNGVPRIGAKVFVRSEGLKVRDVYVYDPAPEPFEIATGEVLYVDQQAIKIRLRDRRELIMSIDLDATPCQIGSEVLVRLADDRIINWQRLDHKPAHSLKARVYEKQTRHQLKIAYGLTPKRKQKKINGRAA
jgi:hypothetical protein